MKEFRFTMHLSGNEITGEWRAFDMAAILKDCEAFADNGAAFTLEFR